MDPSIPISEHCPSRTGRATARKPDPGCDSRERELADLYDSDGLRLYRYALVLTQHRESAQDAVQESFLRYYVARTAGQSIQNPRAWLFRVLRNHILDGLRTLRVQNEVGMDGFGEWPDRAQNPEAEYRRDELAQHISQSLSPRELECVRLRAEGLSYEEISEVIAVRAGTVGALLARAHKKICKSLRRVGYVAPNKDIPGTLELQEVPYAS